MFNTFPFGPSKTPHTFNATFAAVQEARVETYFQVKNIGQNLSF